jgi:hypothetical protein
VSKGAEILIVSSNNLEILDRKINALLAWRNVFAKT